ncbi:MAG: molybdopterin-dependent oxidoreductase [Candidatus Eisenbacteria bacterium]|nr:molybdopterin-dependent oxidoreductase [Candidatus Latescibacterota bacterium]MBD3301292.1 molybdopterin-dependent oxidoreductase [Candidatus Eisenbacteria bacterium]
MGRREFLRIASAAAGGAAVGGGLMSDWYGLDAPRPIDPGTDGDRIVPTFCELCFWKCGVLAHVKNGRVTKLKGNPAHPLSRGRLCPRGAGGTGLLYDPDRLKHPLIRVGGRGGQRFARASWDDALDRIAEEMIRIREVHGPEAFALFLHGYGGSWFTHLFKAYGSPNVTAPSYAQCRGPREVGFQLTFGEGVGSPERVDMERAECIVLIGSHLGENMHNTQVQDFARAVGRGARIVVVDPRFSTAASKADEWLPIKPGTDLALLLAWMHVLIEEDRYDRDYVERYAYGFESLAAHVAETTPEWAYPRTGIRPEVIRRTARMMGAARPAVVVHPGRRVVWYGDDTQRSRAIAMLTALLGSWGRAGGYLHPSAMELPRFPYLPYETNGAAPADRSAPSDYPLADQTLASGLCDAAVPGSGLYDVKGWMVYGTNLPLTLPDPERTYEALRALDFVAAIDVLPAEITGWADVVLPEATYLERCDEVHAPAYKEPFFAIRQEVVPPRYESKPGWWIAREIARRIGLEGYFPWTDSMEYAKERIAAAGHDCEAIRETGVVRGETVPCTYEEGVAPRFWTSTGKIELYSPRLAEAGFDPMPVFTPPEEPPSGYFRLLVGRVPVHSFGRTANNRLLAEVCDENEVWVAASVARDYGLRTGDRVLLVNQDGIEEGPVRVKATERIRPDAVFLAHGFGHRAPGLRFARGKGADDARLMTRVKVDPIMGGTGINGNFVALRRV